MTLYGISNCNTVQKARNWLAARAISYQFHDFKKQGIDAATLACWLEQTSWEKLVNRSGMTWRHLSAEAKAAVIDNDSAIALMLEKTSVIKRPVLIRDDKLLALGFSDDSYRQLFE